MLGIHTIVPHRIGRQIISARHRASFPERPVQEFAPHVTLYLCRFSKPAYWQLLAAVRGRRFPSVVIHFDRVRVTADQRGLRTAVLGVRRTKALARLHASLIKLSNPLRGDLLRKKDVLRIRSGVFSVAERNVTVRYGYRGAGSRYAPHVTVTHAPIRSGNLRQLLRSLRSLVGMSWRANRMVVGLYRYSNLAGRYVGQSRERIIRLG